MEQVRIQDDLFNHVNGEWIEKAVIPDDRPTAGGFSELSQGVEKLLMADFKSMSKSGEYPNEYMERAGAIYLAAKNTRKRNRQGIKPVLKNLSRIEKLTGIPHFNRNLKELVLDGFPLPFEIGVTEDMKDSNKHCLWLQGPGTILPDTTYYKEEMAQQKEALLSVWSSMVSGLLLSAGLSEENAALYISDALKFDAVIAGLVKSSEEWSEYTKSYNPMTTKRVGTLLRPVAYKSLLTKLFGFVPETTIVGDVRFLKGFSTLFNPESFDLYKHWAYIKVLIASTSYLSEELRNAGSVYSRTLSGVASVPKVEKYAYQLAGRFYSEPIGLYYGERYFGEEAKKDVVEMVYEIIETYKKRVNDSTILSDETKAKAVLKLSTMRVKMGYPDRINDIYSKLVFNPSDSLYKIAKSLYRIRNEDSFSKLTEPVDKSEWLMPGHMVNA